ncbi:MULTISPECIES: cyclic peptide export ABC transporter [Paenibacillus]|uniref:Cyclic peptide export ABC transporter n=1 Tax=Paenibacillus alvei TaxID=44250 RepID=A0ABT4ECN5_PAEAL|nr:MULTISPECIES: cyclic peptide export ABC transporter [Paenibacillus]MCY9530253.1 cyclic peptide export ABC transporter [Paenibacillus alvei]SDF67375.1 cyclic peptide transporter [Paenibacillus sp. cl6col]
MKRSKVIILMLFMLLICSLNQEQVIAATVLPNSEEVVIENFIRDTMNDATIPGLSAVIVKGDETIYSKGFGYADIKAEKLVTPDTLFELGSTSKAFTALAILQLEDQGKLNLDDSVTKYIPWFQMNYEGENVDITLKHLLHHTSGIPFKTIGDIPIQSGNHALEETVRTLMNKSLDFMPGEKFHYATINYDVLGFIIQQVTGESFENYLRDQILKPLDLNNTYLFRNEAELHGMAKGYKPHLLTLEEYDAPIYRGNVPAGYVITNAIDIAKWLKIQIGRGNNENFNMQLVEKSHLPDRTVPPGESGSSYAAGWSVFQSGTGEISHEGSNPNFSSFIVFRPQDQIGVAVLANSNSANTKIIGQGIMDILRGIEPHESVADTYKNIDITASVVIFVTFAFIPIILFFTSIAINQTFRKKRKFMGQPSGVIKSFMLLLIFTIFFAFFLYKIPDVLYFDLNWDFVRVWAPDSLIYAVISLFISVLLFNIYYLLTSLFPKEGDKSLLVLIMLSLASGFGNSLIIFVINETLNRSDNELQFQSGLLLYFIFGIVIYVVGQKLVRTRMITITNNIIYDQRTKLISKILGTPYQKIELLEQGNIQTTLINDAETVSDFSNIIVTGATSLVTLICCFLYMGSISSYGMFASIMVIVIAAGLHFIIGRQANKLWEQTRDIQNTFYKFIHDMIGGFKELSLHRKKQLDFKQDLQISCENYRDKQILGSLKFANINVIGELLFTFVIGAVVFAFPLLFKKQLTIDSLRNYVFIFLYMTGPVHGILRTIPSILRVRISWSRINQLSKQLNEDEGLTHNENSKPQSITLELKAVEYSYKNREQEFFTIGPINCVFQSGEITFITGGNGSGKSTMAKLLTGLYKPDCGEISVNGKEITYDQLSQNYSAIFSDFYLFDKLYGVDYSAKENEIKHFLKILLLNEKVHIQNGKLSTTKLSTGQRKRLALLISYLEDRPIYLFDEWAADQDPEFREFFYYTLLPELKNQGKCIIAVTHDDRFYHVADKFIKMEMGKIVQMKLKADSEFVQDEVV